MPPGPSEQARAGLGRIVREECCASQDFLVPALFRLMRESLSPGPCGFWKSKGHLPLVSSSSEGIPGRNRFLEVFSISDDADASMNLEVH